jgi:hypothetical protein
VTIGGFIRGASSAQQSHGLFVHVEGSSESKHLASDVQRGLPGSSRISWPWLAASVSPQHILAEVPGLLLDVGDAEKASFEKADGCRHASKPSICNDLLGAQVVPGRRQTAADFPSPAFDLYFVRFIVIRSLMLRKLRPIFDLF